MYKSLFVIILLFMVFQWGYAQRIYPSNKNFVLANNRIWDLRSDSSLLLFNSITKSSENIPTTKFKIGGLCKDDNDNIFASTAAGRLMRLDTAGFKWVDNTPAHFQAGFDFAIDHKGICFQVTDKGLLDTESGRIYKPGYKFSQSEFRKRGGEFGRWEKQEIDITIDQNNVLWFGMSYGEWGSDFYSFDTISRQYIKQSGKYMDGGIFEGIESVYCTGGGRSAESFSPFSVLLKLAYNPDKAVFTEQIVYNTSLNAGHEKLMKSQFALYGGDDYFGIPAFNKVDGNIYFPSPFGLYKGDPKKDLTDISKWTKVDSFTLEKKDVKQRMHQYMKINPKDSVDMQENYDIFLPYAIHHVGFTNDGQLVFTSYHDGLGIFDGKKITILKASEPGE